MVPASEGVALDDTSIRTEVNDLVNNLGDSTTIDVSGWNTSGVTDMSQVF
ncbi:hypothetical protein C1A34_00545 [Lactobacillus amylovorus]|nr:hypothetical protein DWV49_07375 [Lactobacillus amylovorus]TBH78148.1 hypothetical protein C1A34_00545 [Lactobacillus amylovorus]